MTVTWLWSRRKRKKENFLDFLCLQYGIRKLVIRKVLRALFICRLLQLWGWQSLFSAQGTFARPSGVTKLDWNSYFRHFDQIIFRWGHYYYDAKTSLGMTTNWRRDWLKRRTFCRFAVHPTFSICYNLLKVITVNVIIVYSDYIKQVSYINWTATSKPSDIVIKE